MKRVVGAMSAVLVAFSFGITAPSGAAGPSTSATDADDWCSASPAPCIVSATVDGNPVDASHPQWELLLFTYPVGTGNYISLGIYDKVAESNDLGPDALDDDWVFIIDPGSVAPRVVSVHGKDVSIQRGSTVRIEATPIRLPDNDDCVTSVWPWTCPETATREWQAYLDVLITDYGVWTNAAQRRAFYGMNLIYNVAVTSLPPEIVPDPATGEDRLLIRMASHHYYPDGTTLFRGFYHLRIPNRFLRRVYGIDDPSTLTGAGLQTTGAGPGATVVVSQESSGSAMLVDITDMTFSRRRVRISRGLITPTKPKDVTARRVAPDRAKLKFTASKRRGSKITGYKASCLRGATVLSGRASKSPVVVRGLTGGVKYACRVRALSKAGPGPWSAKVRA